MEDSFSTEVFIAYLVLACLNYGFSSFLQSSLGYQRPLHSFIFFHHFMSYLHIKFC